MNMARKCSPADYQIGAWNVQRFGRRWLATAPGFFGTISLCFKSLRDAHLQLTGEPMHESTERTINRGAPQ